MNRIMRHFEIQDLAALRTGRDFGEFDGFIYGHHGFEETQIDLLVQAGKKFLRYLNVLEHPEDSWRDPWFDFVRQEIIPLANEKGVYAAMNWTNPPRKLWDWSLIEAPLANQIIDHLITTRAAYGARGGFFLDQFWLRPAEWMFGPAGAPYSDFDPMKWYYWQRNISYFLSRLRKRHVLRQEIVMVNGDWSTTVRPLMLEHAERRQDQAEAIYSLNSPLSWENHLQSMLSVYPSPLDVSWAVDLWMSRSGWISFAGPAADDPAIADAYQRAAEARK